MVAGVALTAYDQEAIRRAVGNPTTAANLVSILNAVDTLAATETAFIDGVSAGTALASKALVVGTSKEIATVGAITASETATVTITGPTAPDDAIKGVALLTVGYSAGSANAIKGVVTCSAVAGQTVRNMSAGWFGLEWTADFAATGAGVSRALAAEVVTKCASAKGNPNAVLYLQSIASAAGASHANMPYVVFTDSGSGTQSNILFELGHDAASQQVSIGTGNLFYENTIQIAVNESAGTRTAWYIPLSSAEASYTTVFPIVSTYSGGNAISVTVTAATTSAYTGITVNNSFTKTDGGVHKGISSTVTYTPASSGYSTPIGIAGKVVLGSTFTGGTGYMWGVQGQMDFGTSKQVNNLASIFAGVRGVLTGTTPTFTDADEICCFYADNLINADMSGLSTGNSSFYRAHLIDGAAAMNNFLHIWGSNGVTNFVHFEACGGMVSADSGTTFAGDGVKIAINVDGSTFYLKACTSFS